VGENLSLSIGKDQRQLVRKPLAVVQDLGSTFLRFLPMVGELQRAPMRDVAILSFAEYAVEHSRCTQQADMPAMQRCKRPATNITLLGEKQSAALAVGCRIQQQILYFIERNAFIYKHAGPPPRTCKSVFDDSASNQRTASKSAESRKS